MMNPLLSYQLSAVSFRPDPLPYSPPASIFLFCIWQAREFSPRYARADQHADDRNAATNRNAEMENNHANRCEDRSQDRDYRSGSSV
jgi:hypothetical protein